MRPRWGTAPPLKQRRRGFNSRQIHQSSKCSAYHNEPRKDQTYDQHNPNPTARELVAARQRRQKELPIEPAGKKPQARSSRSSARSRRPRRSRTTIAYIERYLDEVAPSGIVGRMIKSSPRTAPFTEDEAKRCRRTPRSPHCATRSWSACEVQRPRRAAGSHDGPAVSGLHHAAKMRDLPDRDESQWELGLDGQPADPWGSMYLPLQRRRHARAVHAS